MVTLDSTMLANKAIAPAMDGIPATQASLTSGAWPVRRPQYLTTNGDPAKVKPAIQALVAFIKSPAGQAIIGGH